MLIAAGPTGVGKSWIACSRGSGFGGGDLRVPIEGAIVTIDAIGRQKAIAKKIIDKGADYLLSRLCPNASHAIPYGVVRRCVRIPDHPPGLPVLRALSLCACCRHYPGAAAGRRLRSNAQPYQPSLTRPSGRPAHRPFRGLLGVHAWADDLLAKRKALEERGAWAAKKTPGGTLEPENAETRAWM